MNVLINKLETLICNMQWSDATLYALEIIDVFANIKYQNSNNKINYENWVKTQIIDVYDDLNNKYPELHEFRSNNNLINTNKLQNIFFSDQNGNGKRLEEIIYKLRCSVSHSRITILKNFPNNNVNTKVNLCIDEDNVFYFGQNEIYCCPYFLSQVVKYSVNNYITQILSNIHSNEYQLYCECMEASSEDVRTTLKPEAISFHNHNNVDPVISMYVKDETEINIEDAFFQFLRKEEIVSVKFDNINRYWVEEQGLTIVLKENINNLNGVFICKNNKFLNDLLNKLI